MAVEKTPKRITFLGCGKLNTAILEGILDSLTNSPPSSFLPPPSIAPSTAIAPTSLTACVHHQSSASALSAKFASSPLVSVLADQNVLGVQSGDIVILGVEPSVYRAVLGAPGMRAALEGKIVVSIVGGVSVPKLYDAIFNSSSSSSSAASSSSSPATVSQEERWQHCPVVRVTPSPSAAVRACVSLISEEEEGGYRCPAAVLGAVYSLFMRVGEVKMWPERLQPAGATVVAGGLAFLSVAVEGLVESAVREGIEREEASQMAAGCMMGLAKMIAGGESPGGVRGKVATPGGSTAAGLKVLEEGKVKDLYLEALRVTTFRTSRLDDPKE